MIPSSWITLAGPGGAGKSSVGALVAERLGIAFTDLDRRFADRAGDINARLRRAIEEVILGRFPTYVGLRARKIETTRPLGAIVDELLGYLGAAT